MNTNKKTTRTRTGKLLTSAVTAGLLMVGLAGASAGFAADHKDAVIVNSRILADITDFFAFVDPNQTDHVVLMFGVNPFINPNVGFSVRFEENFLYQIKIDNDQSNGLLEDLVVQIEFDPIASRGQQTYSVKVGAPQNGITGPTNNLRLADSNIVCTGTVYEGLNNQSFADAVEDCGTGKAFVGITDDSFSFDVSQFVGRIGINPDPVANAPIKTQDTVRGFDSPLFGDLRGRPLRFDELSGVNSGVDGVGGFNIATLAVSIPTSLIRGSGFPDPSQGGAVNPSLISTWSTVSRPAQESFDGFDETGVPDASAQFNQFDRNGHQFVGTVFGFQRPPLNAPDALTASPFGFDPVAGAQRPDQNDYPPTGALKNLINATGPEDDVANFGYLIPDAILFSELLAPTSGNSVQGRAAVLTASGFTSPGLGTPLMMPQLAADSPLGTSKDAYRQLVLPDTLRLNVDIIPDAVRAGAAAADNADPVLGIGRWGLQNGRRPADDAADIFVRMARETFDVKFPDNLIVQGLGVTEFPGSNPLQDRRALQCEQLDLGIAPVLGEPISVVGLCEDSRVFLALGGTDWFEPTQADVNNMATQVQLRTQQDSFPYVGIPHPATGEAETVGFPSQHQDDL